MGDTPGRPIMHFLSLEASPSRTLVNQSMFQPKRFNGTPLEVVVSAGVSPKAFVDPDLLNSVGFGKNARVLYQLIDRSNLHRS